MITDVGKTIVPVTLQNGQVLNMFNTTLMPYSSYQFLSSGGKARYNMTLDGSVAGMNCRSLHFTRSYSSEPIYISPLPVIYVPNIEVTSTSGIPAQPLFEVIAPQIDSPAPESYQITWWSNVDDASSLQSSSLNKYIYDWTKLKLFSTDTLGEEEDNPAAAKILCTADLSFEYLQIMTNGAILDIYRSYPVVRNVAVIAVVKNEGYITDFSAGGSGGTKIHAHTSTEDCGFAAAVYMPSAIIKPFSWK